MIDLESRTSEELAKKRYSDLKIDGFYLKEVFFERLASMEELSKSYHNTEVYDLSEQELTGLVRGALRVQDFVFAFELAQNLISIIHPIIQGFFGYTLKPVYS